VAAGSRDYYQTALGASYSAGALQMDYAFSMPLAGLSFGDTFGSHRFSFTYHFGSSGHTRFRPINKPEAPPSVTKLPQNVDIEIIPLLE
jgi:hypothetical protein